MTEPTETILVVDDDRTFCKALSGALRRRGFKVVVAHSHADGLAEANAWTPFRAVVDLCMPGPNGIETVAALIERHPDLPVVVLTGYGSIVSAIEAIKAGAIHYLTKPASVEDILAAFERTQPVSELPVEVPALEQVEWEHLQRVLAECEGNVSEAARRLGMHRRSLQRKLARGRPK